MKPKIPLPPKAPLGKVIPRPKPAKVQHTPGPWICDPGGVLDAEFYVYDEKGNALTKDTYVHQANARLIAAAPELLEACKEMLECISFCCDPDDTKQMRDEALAAIAKATT